MPQVLKDEVRDRILAASLEIFAAHGYERATVGAIAERAGMGAASLYRYYPSKSALFDAVVTPALARRFEALLERRVSALARQTLRAEAGDDLGGEMLAFWLENRLAVVILLDRAAGTPYECFGERFVEQLTRHTLAEIRAAHPGVKISAEARFVLTRVFEHTRRMLAAVLEQHPDAGSVREAVRAFWAYQIAGLRGFSDWLARGC
jgi:AcrR family transcriptional regulator